jgi:hypothetical protein
VDALGDGASLRLALAVALLPALLPGGHGWHTGAARVDTAGCARCVQTFSRASTARYRDPPNQFPPHRTMAGMRSADIVIQVVRSWEPDPPTWMHERRPLRIVRSQIHSNFEGNTTHARVSLWSTSTWRAGSFVTVMVLFGRPVPTAADVVRAQRELDATRYPRWRLE